MLVRSSYDDHCLEGSPVVSVPCGANDLLQNLVPLLLRPLRLVLPAERLRVARVFLLKATHFPVVALILGWETWRLHWSDRHEAKSSSRLASRKSIASASLRRPLTPLPLLSAGARQTQLVGQTRMTRSPVGTPTLHPSLSRETLVALETAVENLRTQLDTISLFVASETQARSGA